MHVSTKEIEYCKLEIQYQGDSDAVKEKTQEAIAGLRKVQIPGYRAGKAPDYAIKARCQDKIKQWVTREMAIKAYDDAVFETKIKTIGQPQFSDVKLDGNIFSCKMVVLKKPDFTLGTYKGFDIPKPHVDSDATASVERTVQDLRMRFGDVEPYKDGEFVETGDQVTMDFSATVDGNAFDGSKAEGVMYTVGGGAWAGFDDNLLGMNPGETREFDFVLPPALPNVGGKMAKFSVTIHMGAKRVPCAIDDELAKKVGLNTFEEVKQKLTVIANEKIANETNNKVKQQIIARIVDSHDFVVPSWLLDMEAKHIVAQNGVDWKELTDELREPFVDKARKQIKLSLILDSIRDTEPESVLSDAEVIEALKKQVASHGNDPEKFLVESQKSGQLLGMMAQLKDQFTLQWLVKASNIIE